MVKYECFRCGFINNIKSRFINHLNRKFTCKPKIKDITIEEIYNNYFNKDKKKIKHKLAQSEHKLAQSEHKLAQNEHKLAQNKRKLAQIDDQIYSCNFCKKKFKHLTSKCRHEKKFCKKKKNDSDYIDLKKLVKLLNEQLKEKDKQLNLKLKEKDKQISELMKKVGVNIGTQNNINNIQQNIKILAYNKTDMTHLKDKNYFKR